MKPHIPTAISEVNFSVTETSYINLTEPETFKYSNFNYHYDNIIYSGSLSDCKNYIPKKLNKSQLKARAKSKRAKKSRKRK